MHESVFAQDTSSWPKELKAAVERARADRTLVDSLLPLEEELKARWASLPAGEVVTPALTSLGPRLAEVVNKVVNVGYSLIFWRK